MQRHKQIRILLITTPSSFNEMLVVVHHYMGSTPFSLRLFSKHKWKRKDTTSKKHAWHHIFLKGAVPTSQCHWSDLEPAAYSTPTLMNPVLSGHSFVWVPALVLRMSFSTQIPSISPKIAAFFTWNIISSLAAVHFLFPFHFKVNSSHLAFMQKKRLWIQFRDVFFRVMFTRIWQWINGDNNLLSER